MSTINHPALYTELLLPNRATLFIANYGQEQYCRIIDANTVSLRMGMLEGFKRDPVELSYCLSFQAWCLSQPEVKHLIAKVNLFYRKKMNPITLFNAGQDWASEANELNAKLFEKLRKVYLAEGACSEFMGALYGFENRIGFIGPYKVKSIDICPFCSGFSENGIRLTYLLMKVEVKGKNYYFDVCARRRALLARLKQWAEKLFIPIRIMELEPEVKRILYLNKPLAVHQISDCIVNSRQSSFRVVYPGLVIPKKRWENESLVQRFNRTGFV